MKYCSLSQSFCFGIFIFLLQGLCYHILDSTYVSTHQKIAIEYWVFINWFLWKAIHFAIMHCLAGAGGCFGSKSSWMEYAVWQSQESTFLALKDRYFKFILVRAVNFCLKNKQISSSASPLNILCSSWNSKNYSLINLCLLFSWSHTDLLSCSLKNNYLLIFIHSSFCYLTIY